MAKKKIDTRVDDLEKLKNGSPVVAIRIDGAPTVRIAGTNEELTVEEVEARYPEGVIFRIEYDKTDTDTDT